MNKSAAFLLSIVLLFASCNFKGNYKKLKALNDTLSKNYKCKNISINVMDDKINVTLINSDFNDSSDEVKQREADKIGQIVVSLVNRDTLAPGGVAFTSYRRSGIVEVSNSTTFKMNVPK